MPGDVAVVGWDATVLTASTVPTLTSVAPDTHALASRALDLLLARMDGDDAPGRHVTVGYEIVHRESAPAVDRPAGSTDPAGAPGAPAAR